MANPNILPPVVSMPPAFRLTRFDLTVHGPHQTHYVPKHPHKGIGDSHAFPGSVRSFNGEHFGHPAQEMHTPRGGADYFRTTYNDFHGTGKNSPWCVTPGRTRPNSLPSVRHASAMSRTL
mmetsp:Transcript_88399/g.205674  ORF Transcript_88399/g.205674 Transcript_88399/m.205674 type:complete len:120 (+) Transcript_88399:65-424(+)|eukprot:CAMPEP_0171109654 /NCGR_PEP_ID=MMETSP0766_2-20121228/70903_1 /TAXON_ID=439317 /ORGANISM="Gambierdiscus australes, Strain CAWD 149" /LENGTH=119 /DNA_ID=CAMNT_0011571421 /DNA_START=63 /DNA_END=422 /DNA_ORIENTATION=+